MKHWNEMSPHWHEAYERGRPSYPHEVTQGSGLTPSSSILEVGAGTGKLTRVLVGEFDRVVGVEPDPTMRHWFSAACPDAMLIGGVAEHLPLAGSSVDGVFVAEAFHWFAHDQALKEIARVLRPGGALVLLWNRPTGPVEPAIAEVDTLLAPHWPADISRPLDLEPSRFPYARDWPLAFTDSAFEPLREVRLPNPQHLDRDGLVAFFASMGWIDALPERELVQLLAEIRVRLTADAYLLPLETEVHWTRLAVEA